ncbi:MAG: excinuclease ABC subunit UvrC [Candidatus Omnitrophota bacterium]|nr:excinuclease ABC subunit UvrC [Candidatus Omnitrophota bacterium]
MDTKKQIKDRIKELPDAPGVYKFLDADKHIVYVGKAGRLRRRVASYFNRGKAKDDRAQLLLDTVKHIEYIQASSEAEALIYEAGLIKDYRPRFNIELKDDRSYPFLKLSINEKYPRLTVTRRRLKDGAVYYGPYVNVKLLKEAVSFMKKIFPLRTCMSLKKKVCLEYHIGQCQGPCENKIGKEEYAETVGQLKKFLEGKKEDLMDALRVQMNRYSKAREYEKAINVKRRVEALTAVRQMHDRSEYPMFGELDELKNTLELKKIPMRIECFDISNINGKESVGAMVIFVSGRPCRSGYRKFRIKESVSRDDYSMISEVVRRRYSRVLWERKPLPDLVIIDGGKGHLSAAHEELSLLGLADLPVVSIAKEKNHLYRLFRKTPIRLSPGSRMLFIIQRIRDEAHRFAITYHRSVRIKKAFSTVLSEIRGIGPVKEDILMERFGSIDKIKDLTEKELVCQGIDKKAARAVSEYFKQLGYDRTAA